LRFHNGSRRIFDIDAMSVAVPYCDIVATEHHACHALKAARAEELVEELEAAQTEIAERREASRDDLLTKLNAAQTGLDIGIDLKVGGDRSVAIGYMRDEGFLTRDSAGHFRDRRIAERCCAMAKPTTTARALLAGDATRLEADGVALEPVGAHAARVEDTGSIDDREIIDDVLAIMECGREAFQARNRRYRIES
jgi:hypothetical protein